MTPRLRTIPALIAVGLLLSTGALAALLGISPTIPLFNFDANPGTTVITGPTSPRRRAITAGTATGIITAATIAAIIRSMTAITPVRPIAPSAHAPAIRSTLAAIGTAGPPIWGRPNATTATATVSSSRAASM